MDARDLTDKQLRWAQRGTANGHQGLSFTLPNELVEALVDRLAHLAIEQAQQYTPERQPVSPWLTVDQACAYLGFSRDTLYKLTAAKAIPFRKKQGGQGLRFHRDELDTWMETQYPRVDRLA